MDLYLRRSKRTPCRSAPMINVVPYWKINHALHAFEVAGDDPSTTGTKSIFALQARVNGTPGRRDKKSLERTVEKLTGGIDKQGRKPSQHCMVP